MLKRRLRQHISFRRHFDAGQFRSWHVVQNRTRSGFFDWVLRLHIQVSFAQYSVHNLLLLVLKLPGLPNHGLLLDRLSDQRRVLPLSGDLLSVVSDRVGCQRQAVSRIVQGPLPWMLEATSQRCFLEFVRLLLVLLDDQVEHGAVQIRLRVVIAVQRTQRALGWLVVQAMGRCTVDARLRMILGQVQCRYLIHLLVGPRVLICHLEDLLVQQIHFALGVLSCFELLVYAPLSLSRLLSVINRTLIHHLSIQRIVGEIFFFWQRGVAGFQ